MSKGFNYYEAYVKQAEYIDEITKNLADASTKGELRNKEIIDALHTMENDADTIVHEIQTHLEADFVVPMERDHMLILASTFDDAVDAVEDIAITAYMMGISGEQGKEMIQLLVAAAEELSQAAHGLEKAGKSNEVQEHVINLNDIETECDAVFIESGKEAAQADDWKLFRFYQSIEKAMDTFELVGTQIGILCISNA